MNVAVAVPTMRDDALALAAAGYRIVPLPPGMKAAPPSGWPDLATNDAARIAQWWNAQPQANIAVVGGNGLLLLDVDTRKGGDASLAALEAKHGALPPTLTVLTPSGGRHFYFAGPDVENSAGKIGAGLDIKSRNGYVVAPPSVTVAAKKQSAGAYRWADVTVPIASAPQWLIDLAGAPKVTTDAPSIRLREATAQQWADIRSALDHLAQVPEVASNKLWSDIGYTLLCLGDEGRELFCEWSARAPGYDLGAPEAWWNTHSAERAHCNFHTLFVIAREHGWKNPNPGGDPASIQWSTGPLPSGASNVPPPAAADPYTQRIDRTDQGNANLLIHLSKGDLRYIHETRQWLRWTGSRWQIDTHETFVTSHALEVAKHYLEQCRSIRRGAHQYDAAEGTVTDSDDIYKWATKCRSKAGLEAMIALARRVPGVPISVTELDKNPWLLGVDNGVVDLRTGELRTTEAREDLVTKRCPIKYDPAARAPRWEQVLEEITGAPIPAERDDNGDVIPATVGRFTPRPQIARYLQKALGYSITGEPREHLFFMAVGEGSNGKSLLFDVVKHLLGPYAKPVSSELFLATKRAPDAERPTALAASLAGVRLVISSETRKGQELDIGVIKAHTGDDDMTARAMRQDPFTFKISHKPWLLTNDHAKIEHLDKAMRGRLHFVPFDRRWNRPAEPERDPALPDGEKALKAYLLRDESEGILRWLVQGAMLYQAEGLEPPAEVVESTSAYFLEQDTLGRWLATMQRCRPHEGMRASDLFDQFAKWCATEAVGIDPHTQKAFSTALDKRSVESKVMRDGTRYGLRRVVPDPVPTPTETSTPAPAPAELSSTQVQHQQQLAAALQHLGRPAVVSAVRVLDAEPLMGWLASPQYAHGVAAAFEAAGYLVTINPSSGDGLWQVSQYGRGPVYGRRDVAEAERVAAAVAMLAPRRMTEKAGAWTYDQLRAAGWADEQLLAEGLMIL